MLSITPEFYLAAVAVFCAGVIRGFSGFGAGMVLVPSLSMLYNPLVAVVTVVLLEMIPAIQLLPNSITKCHWRSVVPMAVLAVASVPVGAFLLVHSNESALRVAIAVLVLVSVMIMATGWHYKGALTRKASGVTGVASGLIGGATGLGGVPVILYYLSADQPVKVVRASIVVFLVLTSIVSLLSFISYDIITADILINTIWLAPIFILAVWFGSYLFGKVSESVFRRFVLMLLAGVGLVMLFS